MDLTWIDRLERGLGQAISYVFLAVAAIIAYEVAARYLFNAPTFWAHELTTTLTAIGFLFGGAYAQQRREHIRITSVHRSFPQPLRWLADLISYLIMLFYVFGLIYAGWIVAGRAWARMETSGSAWNQPTPVVLKTALVVAAALLAVQAVTQLLQHLGLARRSEQSTDGAQ
ncbi:MAG: TRAP transporter small permease subunit [bacterium]